MTTDGNTYVQSSAYAPLKVANLRVLSLSINYNELYWEVIDAFADVLDYTFQILRSEAPMGPWTKLSPEFEDKYIFVDNKVKVGNNYRTWYYLLRVKHKATGNTEDVGPVQKEPTPDLLAVELGRHLGLLFSEFAGRRCWLLPSRTTGQRCPNCWNVKLQKRLISGCRTCFDTSFVRGYHHPIECWIQFDPSSDNEQVTNVGKLQQSSTTARMGPFPPVKVGDLLVEAENKRWRIRTLNTTEQGRSPVLQNLELHLVPMTDMEYLVPLQLDKQLKDISFNPSRNYVNPQNLTNDAEREIDFPLVMQLYPSGYSMSR